MKVSARTWSIALIASVAIHASGIAAIGWGWLRGDPQLTIRSGEAIGVRVALLPIESDASETAARTADSEGTGETQRAGEAGVEILESVEVDNLAAPPTPMTSEVIAIEIESSEMPADSGLAAALAMAPRMRDAISESIHEPLTITGRQVTLILRSGVKRLGRTIHAASTDGQDIAQASSDQPQGHDSHGAIQQPNAHSSNKPPKYPREALAKRLSGVVTVHMVVEPDGSVSSVSVAQSSGVESLDRAAMDAAAKWRFEPATEVGVPVQCEVNVPVVFSLKQ